jgi:hypothetical protein
MKKNKILLKVFVDKDKNLKNNIYKVNRKISNE